MRIIYNESSISSQITMNQSKQQEQINRMIEWIQCRHENIIFKWMKIKKFELLLFFLSILTLRLMSDWRDKTKEHNTYNFLTARRRAAGLNFWSSRLTEWRPDESAPDTDRTRGYVTWFFDPYAADADIDSAPEARILKNQKSHE